MKLNKFLNVKDKHFNNLITIKTKFNELCELECQWKGLFQVGKDILKRDFSINIRGQLFYYLYFFDKYDDLCRDLYSILNGQIIDQKGFLSNCFDHIHEKDESEFYDPNSKIPINHQDGDDPYIQSQKHKDVIRRSYAKARYQKYNELLRNVVGDEGAIGNRKENLRSKKKIIKELRDKIEPLRHRSSHKYEMSIIAGYAKEQRLELSELKGLFDDYFEIAENISILVDGVSHSLDLAYNYSSNIQSVVYLIIFGSIEEVLYWSEIVTTESKIDINRASDKLLSWNYFFENESFVEHFVTD